MTNLYDSRGGPVTLGRSIGVGGEAEVFDISGMPGFVAKKYMKSIPALKQNKLRAMPTLANTDLQKIAAWPTDTLHERPNGSVCGLVMRKVPGKDIHVLYGPAHRKATFPKADWKYLLYAAMNCAAAFDTVHKVGFVVGDVNQSNILVTDQMIVTLIDCDSFQMRINGTLYPCEGVGQALYTPPELQSRDLTGIQRTANHDRFGLAVLIFHLLFMGRHPFSGRYLGRGDMPIEKAIQEHRFAYGRLAANFQMSDPPHSLTLADLHQTIGTLFERAFASTSTTGDSRPSAIEWYNALHGVIGSMRGCTAYKSHVFGANLRMCPWCALMKGGAPNYFLEPMPGGIFAFNLAQWWANIEQIQSPSNIYTLLQPEYVAAAPWSFNVAPPPEPVVPSILVTPPAFPPLHLDPPEYEEVTVAPDSFQNSIGLAAVGFGILCPVLAVFGAFLGLAGVGNTLVNSLIVGISFLMGAIVFGVWWVVLEKTRRDEEEESNKLYKQEKRERRRLQDEHLERCQNALNEKKAIAKRKYDEAMRIWGLAMHPYRKEAERRRADLQGSKNQLREAEQSWSSTSSSAIAQFDRKRRDLAALKAKHAEIESQQNTEWQQLQARAKEIQKRDYLDIQFIDTAKLHDIGPTRKATLASYGIETANDIDRLKLSGVSGFGPKRIQTLIEWRIQVETGFSFNAAKGVPQQEKQYFESKFQQLLQPIQQNLLNGQKELETIRQSADAQLAMIYEQIKTRTKFCHQAEADTRSIPKGL